LRKRIYITLGVLVAIYCLIERSLPNEHYGKAYYQLGIECRGKCSLTKTLHHFQTALFYDLSLYKSYYYMGDVYTQMGDQDNAMKLYHKAASLDYRNFESNYRLGSFYLEKDNIHLAYKYLKQAQKHKFWNKEIDYKMGILWEIKGDIRQALWFYREASEVMVDKEKAYRRMGEIHHIMNNDHFAKEQVDNLKKIKRLDLAQDLERYIKEVPYDPSF